MFSGKFVKDAAERAVKTGVQAGVGYLSVVGGSPWNMDVMGLVVAVVGGVLASLATSVASLKVGAEDSASVVK